MIVRPTLGSLPNSRSLRGQPLIIMLTVVALWVGLRASLWSAPMEVPVASVPVASVPLAARVAPNLGSIAGEPNDTRGLHRRWWAVPAPDRTDRRASRASGEPAAAVPVRWLQVRAPTDRGPVDNRRQDSMLQENGLQENGLQSGVAGAAQAAGPNPQTAIDRYAGFTLPPVPVRATQARRLSIDGWLFWREGGVANGGAGPLAPSYGGSQFGAVLRYDLGSRTRHPPQAYLRATAALDAREADLAAGVSVRPLPALPLRAHAELRLSRSGERTELRPAAFVTAGIEEALGRSALRIRGYAQAGYVGGEFATGFADGSLVLERDAKRFERGLLAVGFGVWGGAQRGAERLDAGPTVSMDLSPGRGRVRLAADYRLRIAGQAEPAAGAALTLSTSF